MEAERHPAHANLLSLKQGADLLAALDDDLFTGGSDLLPGGTVGAHFRHCLDFYRAFLGGLESGRIDYDARRRDRSVETDRQEALADFRKVGERLEALRPEELERPVQVRGDVTRAETPAWSRSTMGRELRYLLSHTIHHYALIGSILRARGFSPDREFGVAPSTLRHWERTGARAS